MITPQQIHDRAVAIWQKGDVLRSWCRGENFFPLYIPFKKTTGSDITRNFSKLITSIDSLILSSKEKKGFGYSIEFRETNNRSLGRQRLPHKIFFETEVDFLRTCRKTKDFEKFTNLISLTVEIFPAVLSFIATKPHSALDHYDNWEKVLIVCLYLYNNPHSGIYIRQIPLAKIDTKFIETHKKIISDILHHCFPDRYSETALSHNAFEKRFGLLFEQPLVRFRILDNFLAIKNLTDITLPLSDFASLNLSCTRVFITENKINGLAFPAVQSSIVIFGLGYGIQSLDAAAWLKEKEIIYWGDIDTHGFNMLSMTRNYFSRCKSLMMDENTLLAHRHAWVTESSSKRFTTEPAFLTDDELSLFMKLKENYFGENVRLEQELISFNYALQTISSDYPLL